MVSSSQTLGSYGNGHPHVHALLTDGLLQRGGRFHALGAFKDVHGTLEFDPSDPSGGAVQVVIDASKLWSGEKDRDAHLKAPDFLDVESHSKITFRGRMSEMIGENTFRVAGNLTTRVVTKPATLDVEYLGQWPTPRWEDGEDKGPEMRAGFKARCEIDRHDFGVDWRGELTNGGIVVGRQVFITIEAEAILDDARSRPSDQRARAKRSSTAIAPVTRASRAACGCVNCSCQFPTPIGRWY